MLLKYININQDERNSWMNSVTDVISVIIGRKVSVCIDGIVPKHFDAIFPLCRHKMIGNGNCLF